VRTCALGVRILYVGIVQLNQIRTRLETEIGPHIDMSDVTSGIDVHRLSRGLAAFALMHLVDLDASSAASAITDGGQDKGIDAIEIDAENSIVYLVQSKWSKSGTGSPALGDVLKFVGGFRDLVNAEFSSFNSKVRSKEQELLTALNDPDVRFVLVFAHSGQESLSKEAAEAVQKLLSEVNDPIETASFTMLTQVELHNALTTSIHGKPPDLSVTLFDWGSTQEPYAAYYGQVEAAAIAEWWKKHHVKLFRQNLRQFLGDSEVNASITATLINEPDRFWYFNNGITALCEKVGKSAIGATGKKSGEFAFEGVSIVNGAQTVGCIGRAMAEHAAQVRDARVTVRFISLENCPPDFAEEVTRATNTQNRVGPREFVALDPEQERLATEMALDGKRYAVKSGEATPTFDSGCTVVEATIALACASQDVDLAVQAKREIGRLWAGAETGGGGQYRRVFAPSVTGKQLWQSVLVLRQVEAALELERAKRQGRDRLIGVHGNRLLAHLVFQGLPPGAISNPTTDMDALLKQVPVRVADRYTRMVAAVEANYQTNYLASLFKNASRCRDLAAKI
jgi:hypothetical protein